MGIVICTYNLLKLPLISFSHSSPIQRERERAERENETGHHARSKMGRGRRMNITSSKHSSGLHFISCRRTDKYKHMYKHSGMTIPTSGTHLSGQHRCGWSRWGCSRCGWASVGEGKSHKSRAINQILTLAGAYLLLPGSSWGFGALLKGLTSVVVLRVERALVIHSPHLQSLPDLRLEPATFGLQVRLSTH